MCHPLPYWHTRSARTQSRPWPLSLCSESWTLPASSACPYHTFPPECRFAHVAAGARLSRRLRAGWGVFRGHAARELCGESIRLCRGIRGSCRRHRYLRLGARFVAAVELAHQQRKNSQDQYKIASFYCIMIQCSTSLQLYSTHASVVNDALANRRKVGALHQQRLMRRQHRLPVLSREKCYNWTR